MPFAFTWNTDSEGRAKRICLFVEFSECQTHKRFPALTDEPTLKTTVLNTTVLTLLA
jgi:hypothetical protein